MKFSAFAREDGHLENWATHWFYGWKKEKTGTPWYRNSSFARIGLWNRVTLHQLSSQVSNIEERNSLIIPAIQDIESAASQNTRKLAELIKKLQSMSNNLQQSNYEHLLISIAYEALDVSSVLLQNAENLINGILTR